MSKPSTTHETRPSEGGSYQRDPETGRLTLAVDAPPLPQTSPAQTEKGK